MKAIAINGSPRKGWNTDLIFPMVISLFSLRFVNYLDFAVVTDAISFLRMVPHLALSFL